ncbi:MAG: ABC transporter substrate-binding protein [Bacillota bacterium]
MKRPYSIAGGIILALGGLFLGWRKYLNLKILRVSYNSIPLNLPVLVTRRRGILARQLEQHKVTPEFHHFIVGNEMTGAMEAGKLEIASMMGVTSLITSRDRGRDLRIMAACSQAPSAFAVVTQADSSLDLNNLAGKKIAVTLGTEAHYLLAKALGEVNLTLAHVQLVNLLVPDAADALEQCRVDAAVIVEPLLTRLEADNKIRVLRNGEGLMDGLTVIAGRARFLKYRRGLGEAYLAAHRESLEYIRDNYSDAVVMAAEETNMSPELVTGILNKFNYGLELDDRVMAHIQEQADFLLREGIITRPVKAADLLAPAGRKRERYGKPGPPAPEPV